MDNSSIRLKIKNTVCTTLQATIVRSEIKITKSCK